MSPESQRIAIAEACGATWRQIIWQDSLCIVLSFSEGRLDLGPMRWELCDGRILAEDIPDYLNDLNAMAEAEARMDDITHAIYRGHLRVLITGRNEATPVMNKKEYRTWYSATAAQRAEASLRTLNKWEDGK